MVKKVKYLFVQELVPVMNKGEGSVNQPITSPVCEPLLIQCFQTFSIGAIRNVAVIPFEWLGIFGSDQLQGRSLVPTSWGESAEEVWFHGSVHGKNTRRLQVVWNK